MIAERRQAPPRLRPFNPAVSPAVESIVRHCLEPDPARRYQSARQLQDDLQRHLDYLPLLHAPDPSLRERLAKWKRRHPRLTSTGSLVVAAVLILSLAGGLIWRSRQIADLQKQTIRQQLQADARDAHEELKKDLKALPFLLGTGTTEASQVQEGRDLAQRHLKRYRVVEDADWQQGPLVQNLPGAERRSLLEHMGELLFLLASDLPPRVGKAPGGAERNPGRTRGVESRDDLAYNLRLNELAQACYAAEEVPAALFLQRARLERLAGHKAEADRLDRVAQKCPAQTSRSRYLLVREQMTSGQFRQPLAFLREASSQDAANYTYWLVLGNCHAELRETTHAAACYDTALALGPDSPWIYFNRGLVRHQSEDYSGAEKDFGKVLELRPGLLVALYNRALVRMKQKDYEGAIADLTAGIEQGQAGPRFYFMRGRALDLAGRPEEGLRNRKEGLRVEPRDERDWVARGLARLPQHPQAALDDLDEALRRSPRYRQALESKAHVLAHLGRTEDAVAVLDQALTWYPDYLLARAGRAVLLARLGKREAAHQDARQALKGTPPAVIVYQVAGVYALTSQQKEADQTEAFRLLAAALREKYGHNLLERDPDLAPIQKTPQFRRLVEAARALRPPAPH
jgi:tetratricopeptide (TPR) repeat protein